jgi:hypothetical protein
MEKPETPGVLEMCEIYMGFFDTPGETLFIHYCNCGENGNPNAIKETPHTSLPYRL